MWICIKFRGLIMAAKVNLIFVEEDVFLKQTDN